MKFPLRSTRIPRPQRVHYHYARILISKALLGGYVSADHRPRTDHRRASSVINRFEYEHYFCIPCPLPIIGCAIHRARARTVVYPFADLSVVLELGAVLWLWTTDVKAKISENFTSVQTAKETEFNEETQLFAYYRTCQTQLLTPAFFWQNAQPTTSKAWS
jgi:hypothetical protein